MYGGMTMKKRIRWLILGAFAAALALLPFHATEIGELLPVRTVIVTRSGREFAVDVGAGVRAAGKTVRQALELLRREVTGDVFFRTADQVVVTDDAASALPELARDAQLRPAAGVFLTSDPRPDAERVSDYLVTHPSDVTLLQIRAALAAGESTRIPRLEPRDGGYLVVE